MTQCYWRLTIIREYSRYINYKLYFLTKDIYLFGSNWKFNVWTNKWKNYIKQFGVHDLTFELYRTGSCFENYSNYSCCFEWSKFLYTETDITCKKKQLFIYSIYIYILFSSSVYKRTTEIQTIHMRSTITSMPYQGLELDQRGSYLCYRRRHRAIYQYIHKESSLRLNNFFFFTK